MIINSKPLRASRGIRVSLLERPLDLGSDKLFPFNAETHSDTRPKVVESVLEANSRSSNIRELKPLTPPAGSA
jgi:hypothetical protein